MREQFEGFRVDDKSRHMLSCSHELAPDIITQNASMYEFHPFFYFSFFLPFQLRSIVTLLVYYEFVQLALYKKCNYRLFHRQPLITSLE